MNFWKRLRWIASFVFALVLLIALAVALFHRLSYDESEPGEVVEEQRALPVVPVPARGQPTHNSTGL